MKPAHTLAIGTLLGISATLLACKSTPKAPITQTPQPQPTPAPVPAPQPPKPMLDGTFSDMKLIPGEGDILGIEITISHSQSAPSVTFRCAQGELSKPQYVAATITGATATGMTIRFKTRTTSQCPAATYTGLLADDTMSLSQAGSAQKPEILKHVAKPGDRPKK
jgi:hypothetical protein